MSNEIECPVLLLLVILLLLPKVSDLKFDLQGFRLFPLTAFFYLLYLYLHNEVILSVPRFVERAYCVCYDFVTTSK